MNKKSSKKVSSMGEVLASFKSQKSPHFVLRIEALKAARKNFPNLSKCLNVFFGAALWAATFGYLRKRAFTALAETTMFCRRKKKADVKNMVSEKNTDF